MLSKYQRTTLQQEESFRINRKQMMVLENIMQRYLTKGVLSFKV
jgi:hypothetical protein